MQTPNNPNHVNREQVQDALGCTSSGVYYLIRTGKLPKGKKLPFSNLRVWDRAVIEAFVASREGT